jgi:hypothetical protein
MRECMLRWCTRILFWCVLHYIVLTCIILLHIYFYAYAIASGVYYYSYPMERCTWYPNNVCRLREGSILRVYVMTAHVKLYNMYFNKRYSRVDTYLCEPCIQYVLGIKFSLLFCFG